MKRLLACLLLVFSSCLADDLEDAYIFGYPLVLMDVTKEMATNVAASEDWRAPLNQFAHARAVAGPAFRLFPSPNVDMLSSLAWLDLSQNAYVLHLPTIPSRYFVVELFDGWSNVITSLGPRTTGSNAQDFLLCGPKFKDEVPQNMTKISTPTDILWIKALIQCYNAADAAAITPLQKLITLTPLSSYGQYYAPPQNCPVNESIDMTSPAVLQVANMDPAAFFSRLAKLMEKNPPQSEDGPMAAKLTALGIVPGKTPTLPSNSNLKTAKMSALSKIQANIPASSQMATGWSLPFTQAGQYGANYLLRAAVANAALGANLPSDILAQVAEVDLNGAPLDGQKSYRIHISPSQVPPVNAFWSCTLYNDENYLVQNPKNRYALHSVTTLPYDTLQYNVDGSVDLIFQQKEPSQLATNWLPTPSGKFKLILRLYWPQAQALSGAYMPPPLVPQRM